jgi:hypothetical protein
VNYFVSFARNTDLAELLGTLRIAHEESLAASTSKRLFDEVRIVRV